ncbi:MAG TPA: hypothetical protein VNL13_04925 [Sulfolobales archaeon]|nr:hypothetical protein [Sulfolobales archaeon]
MQGMKKILVIGALIVVAIGLAYPLAVSALSIAAGNLSKQSPNNYNSMEISNNDLEDGHYAFAKHIAVQKRGEDHDDREDHSHVTGRTVLSASINITNTNIPNVSVGDKASLVLLKKGGNYSLLLLVKAKSSKHVYLAKVNITNLTVSSDKISIDGYINRSNVPGFINGSQISIEVKIGFASIASGSYQLSGDVLSIIFKR